MKHFSFFSATEIAFPETQILPIKHANFNIFLFSSQIQNKNRKS